MNRKERAQVFADEGYTVNVTGRNVAVTETMKNYALEKAYKIEKFGLRIREIAITMDIQRYEQRVDIVTKVNDMKIKVSASTNDMYASIDKAVDKLQNHLRRYKTKITDHHARRVDVEDLIVNVLSATVRDDLREINDDIEDENNLELYEKYRPHKVVKQEKRTIKTLQYDEAAMQMDLSGDSFLIFRNEADRKICVMYRRKDGEFAVIETDRDR